ncbi:hypothetical protein GOP47_0026199 [Adiantum capillus-veneris]|nr:hypothetical protein GOP47_0026199 [Adiantum capillus-veneris]
MLPGQKSRLAELHAGPLGPPPLKGETCGNTRPPPGNVSVQGPLQGSQGLLQTLLDLGETFLASELSEVDLQDLEAKLSAVRSRDHGAIRDLQKKIEELSGMSAMVNRLKNELQEEKEKAKEEAEDLTQEMAELRYQLMQRVDEERELRARTEEASLRRIAELEAQLKYAKQETVVLSGWKQSAEVQAKAHTLELQHVKSALLEAKQTQVKLLQDKEDAERCMEIKHEQLQSQITALQAELTSMFTKLRAADAKAEELKKACRGLKEENEAILQNMDQKRVEVQLKAAEEGISQSKRVLQFPDAEAFEDLQTVDQQNCHLLHEVTEMLELVTNFKLQLFVLASEHLEMKGRHQLSSGRSDAQQENVHDVPSLGNSDDAPGPDMVRDVACITDVNESVVHGEVSEDEQITGHEFLMIPDLACLTSAREYDARDVPCEDEFGRDTKLHLRHDQATVAEVKEISMQEISSQLEINRDHASLFLSASQFDVKHERPWTVQTIVNLVDLVTEEMTKLLRALLKLYQHQKLESLMLLESRLQLWSNIPQKALPEKVVGNGVLSEWGDLVVDLLAQSRRELCSMQQRIGDLETERESLGNMQEEFAVLSNEAICAKEELTKAKLQFESKLSCKEDALQILEGKLEQTGLALVQAQTRIAQQELSQSALMQQLHKLEAEMTSTKAVWASEEKCLEESLARQHEAMQKERARANKEIDKLERNLEELRYRLAENEQELEELVHANDLNINAVVAAKLRQLDQKLKNSQLAEAELQAERDKLASQILLLQAKLEDAEREFEAENEQHVEALIQYEEERGLLEAELEAGKRALHSKSGEEESPVYGVTESWFAAMDSCVGKESSCRGEQKRMEKFVEVLKCTILEKDQMLASQKDDLSFQKDLNKKLMNESTSLEAELLSVRQELLLCESQAADMESTIANLQESLLLERMKADQAQADIDMHTKRQDEDYLHFKLRLDELLSNIRMMQADLAESRRRESEAWTQVRKLDAELLLAKEQVKNLEVHLQKSLKELEGQLDVERGKQRQSELRLLQQAEDLKSLEGENAELQRLLVQSKGACRQLERERDDFRIAYMELESQFSRRRVDRKDFPTIVC